MIRGTTPTHIFTIPIDTSLIKEVRVAYAQDDVALVIKTTEDCSLADKTITTTLTQEDTFTFDCRKPVQIQLRVLTTGGKVFNSLVEIVGVSKCLSNEVLV